jgi:hypothetical protein
MAMFLMIGRNAGHIPYVPQPVQNQHILDAVRIKVDNLSLYRIVQYSTVRIHCCVLSTRRTVEGII